MKVGGKGVRGGGHGCEGGRAMRAQKERRTRRHTRAKDKEKGRLRR